MRLLPLKTEAELMAEYEREACTRRIPLGAIALAAWLATALIFAGGLKIASYYGTGDPYVGLCDGPNSY